ncbi:TonB-dependent receptor [Idiomarina seosinensis]|nr:TonB-dependent receptor [Idiomarina seosinensis]
MKLAPLSTLFAIAMPVSSVAWAEPVEIIKIRGEKVPALIEMGGVDELLRQQGVDFSAAGGVSALPVMRGMMGDRIKVLIDGAEITASCANQMNPPLSYVAAGQVQSAQVIAGVTPVSMGGDNIAGVITLNTMSPRFGNTEDMTWLEGVILGAYSSNDKAQTYSLKTRLANDSFSLAYNGSFEDAESYEDGDGNKVLDTLYRAQNHSVTVAGKSEQQQLAVKVSYQSIPFQGYPNQYMDMTNNESFGLTALYQREFDSTEFEGQLNWQQVNHQMGFFTDEKPGKMPMETEADDYSYQLRWNINLSSNHQVRIGQELYHYRLDDWWPAVPDSMMMGPNDYININNGVRQRITGYLESERMWSGGWQTSAGVRIEQIRTDADKVRPYNAMPNVMGMPNLDSEAAADFNQADRKQTDLVVDASVMASHQINRENTLSIGLARKNRAPNLYERYSWGRGTMASTMIGWFGDGNGYIGRIDLKPETAHTLSVSYKKESVDQHFSVEVTPYYTHVNDYIDAEVVRSFSRSDEANGQRNILQFANLDAKLVGLDAAMSSTLLQHPNYGDWQLNGKFSLTKGERVDTGTPLYQISPLTIDLGIEHQLGNFSNHLTWEWAGEKDDVDLRRLENETGSYAIITAGTRWRHERLMLSLEVTNLLDDYYEQPLGGISVAEFKSDNAQDFKQLSGPGRSINLAVGYAF